MGEQTVVKVGQVWRPTTNWFSQWFVNTHGECVVESERAPGEWLVRSLAGDELLMLDIHLGHWERVDALSNKTGGSHRSPILAAGMLIEPRDRSVIGTAGHRWMVTRIMKHGEHIDGPAARLETEGGRWLEQRIDEDGRLTRGQWQQVAADERPYDAVLRPPPGITVCIGTCDGSPADPEEVERALRKALGAPIHDSAGRVRGRAQPPDTRTDEEFKRDCLAKLEAIRPDRNAAGMSVDVFGHGLVKTPEEYVERFGGTMGEARALFAEVERRARPLRVVRPESVGRVPVRTENVCNVTVDVNSTLSADEVLAGIRKAFGDHVADHAEVSVSDTAAARRQVLIESATPPAGVTVEAWTHTLGAMLEDRDPESGLAWCDTAEEVEDGAAFMRWAYPKLRGGR